MCDLGQHDPFTPLNEIMTQQTALVCLRLWNPLNFLFYFLIYTYKKKLSF